MISYEPVLHVSVFIADNRYHTGERIGKKQKIFRWNRI